MIANDNQTALILPGLPPLTWDTYAWLCRISLPSWAGIDVCFSDDGPAPHTPRTTGRVEVTTLPAVGAERFPPSAEQVAAVEHLIANDRWICAAVLAAIYRVYEDERQAFLGDCDDGLEHLTPPLESVTGLRQLVRLHTIHVLPTAKDGCAYVGLELACTWEREHGLGLMLHKNRVLDVGPAELSFREDLCEDDGGTPLPAPPGWGEPPPPVHPDHAIALTDDPAELELAACLPDAPRTTRDDALDIPPWPGPGDEQS